METLPVDRPLFRDWQNQNIITDPLPAEGEVNLARYKNDPIVQASLNRLNGPSFREVYSAESRGGNAGHVEFDGQNVPAVAVNGYANRATGELVIFGNVQDLDRSVTDNTQYAHVTLRAASLTSAFSEVIVGRDYEEGLSPDAASRIDATILLWNQQADERAERTKQAIAQEFGSHAVEAIAKLGSH